VKAANNEDGAKIEVGVLITMDGFEMLSADCPRIIGEIESVMKKPGVGNVKLR